MAKRTKALAAALVLAWSSLFSGPKRPSVQSLVNAELAFAKRTAEAGVKAGFLAYLAEDSIVFRPGPTSGRDVYEKSAETKILLSWYPEFADLAASGDLGYTTGPYEVFSSKSDRTAVSTGHYVTLWKIQADGSWKAVLDAGIPHPALPARPAVFRSEAPAAGAAFQPAGAAAREKAALESLEKGLSEDYVRAAAAFFAPDVRAYRSGQSPAAGKEPALELIRGGAGSWAWAARAVLISGSCDLAYAYGTATFEPEKPPRGAARPFAFLRIWKKSPEGWRIVLDLAAPAGK